MVPPVLLSFYMCVKDHYTRVNQWEYKSGNQAGGHRGINAVWRGVILATYAHIKTHIMCVCVCSRRYGGLYAVILQCIHSVEWVAAERGWERNRSGDRTGPLTLMSVCVHDLPTQLKPRPNPPTPTTQGVTMTAGLEASPGAEKERRCILTCRSLFRARSSLLVQLYFLFFSVFFSPPSR